MNNSQLINQDSGNTEIYTPPFIIEAVRQTFGGFIDLDVASSEKANEAIKANRFYDKHSDALRVAWNAENIWMNHPFSRQYNSVWIERFVRAYIGARTQQACCITFASTSEAWFRPLLNYPQCYLWPRTNYLKPDGSIYRGVTKGSVVTYLGTDIKAFRFAFDGLGTVKI